MVYRVYILLHIVDGKAVQLVQVLQGKPGVIIVDVLESSPVVMLENPPNVIMMIQAPERQQLAKLTIEALATVDALTEQVHLLPARDRSTAGASPELSLPNRSKNRSRGKRAGQRGFAGAA